jgi:Fe-S-cluster-containing dehydrogenase component
MACPFGVPEVYVDRQVMMKCDMCYDRSSIGKKPMCATVCPSQALFFGTHEEIAALRPQSRPTNAFRFGDQTITTRTFVMVPKGTPSRPPLLDVTAAMEEEPRRRAVRLPIHGAPGDMTDPFVEVEV